MKKFEEYPLKPFLLEALKKIHFDTLTPVQEQVIPKALAGNNLIVQSQTGSGKSHSFLIPIIQKIDPSLNQVQAVITAPSRELASQLYQMAIQLIETSKEDIVIANYYGGTDKLRQIEKLSHRQPHLVIGTPGRIFDLMSENALWIQTATMLVIDEGDMTLDLGFLTVVDDIASRMAKEIQMMVFSATIPQKLKVFLNKYVEKPQLILIDPTMVLAEQIENYLINTKHRDRKELVYQLLTMGHPYLALVFCNTKSYAQELSDYLKAQGLKVATIHGDIPSRERSRIIKQVRNLEYQYVVASDLAARGIDIPGVSLVINTEIPKELEFFIHRVGRTGRNKIAGKAYTFFTPDDDDAILKLENKGITFNEVEIYKGEIRPVASRLRRQLRKNSQVVEKDSVLAGIIKHHKNKKVKPGYKKKMAQVVSKHKRNEARKSRLASKNTKKNND